jgi:diaminohydroxyphosphoribosylaminopyrimidine deaminase / 5-amino-6-(5-phosphoribosylamino)uracil reductase
MSEHNTYMRKALSLARKAWGRTSPNPLVGAIVLDASGQQVGAGYHRQAGRAHAEVEALADAGADARGGSIYVTLEPCSTSGLTPPCCDAILAAGLGRVVIGNLDPNPNHAGRAVSLLEAAGLEVLHGIESTRCAALNEAFYCWIRQQRPFVVLKMAMTADGKIATASGQSQWITGPGSRKRVQRLRQGADAILVGGETVRRDNPQLLVRSPQNWPCQPLRLVASRSGDLGDAQLLSDGCGETRVVDVQDWPDFLAKLGSEGITSLLVEGGGELAAAMLRADVVDKVAFFIAPRILGGRESRPVVGGSSPASLTETLDLRSPQMQRSGNDFLLTGYLSDVHRID